MRLSYQIPVLMMLIFISVGIILLLPEETLVYIQILIFTLIGIIPAIFKVLKEREINSKLK
jgi:hypothetical protein